MKIETPGPTLWVCANSPRKIIQYFQELLTVDLSSGMRFLCLYEEQCTLSSPEAARNIKSDFSDNEYWKTYIQ